MSKPSSKQGVVPASVLTAMHQIQQGLAGGGFEESAVKAGLQAIIEKSPPADSSLGSKVIYTSEGVNITETFLAQTMIYNGQLLKRHRNGSGWVPAEQDEDDLSMPFVAATAYVGPFALVCTNARVYGRARINHRAQISDNARVYGSAEVYDYARVYGRARIYGNAKIFGNAKVFSKAEVYDYARVYDNAEVYDYARVYGLAEVFGLAEVSDNDRVFGTTRVSK